MGHKETRENLKETFNNLRCGFKYSLITLVLLLLFVVSMASGLIVPILVLPFVITFVWCYSLKKRYRAWKSLGQKNITYAILIGGVLIVVFSFPLLPLWRFQSIVPISAIAWMAYTFLESQGLKQLKQKYGIDLSHSRTLSLAAILSFIVTYLILLLIFLPAGPKWYINYNIGEMVFLYAFFGMTLISLLLSFPFLIISCMIAMENLK